MLKLLLLIFMNIIPFVHGDSQFETALNAYQKGDFDQSRSIFLELAKEPRWRFASYFNLGNIAVKQKKPGLALGYFRLAQTIAPRDKDLTYNLKFTLNEFKILPPPGSISSYETFRQEVLNRFTFNEISILSAVVLIVFTFVFLRFMKANLVLENKKSPIALYVIGVFLLAVFALLGTKLVDTYTDRGTIIVSKAEIKSGPGPQNATLTEVSEGNEVYIQNTTTNDTGTWKQVTIPGNLTGWVSEQSVLQTSGEGPW